MKTYEVTIWETICHTTIVESDSQDNAYEKAYEIITGLVAGEYETDSEGFSGRYEIGEIAR